MRLLEGYADGLYFHCLDITPPWVTEPEMIIFHHGVGADRDVWAGWIPALSDQYRIVRFDMRGMGRSAQALKGAELPFGTLVDDVISVADAVGASRFHLVGESIGGTIALAVGLRYAQRIVTLTASNAAHFGGEVRSVGDWKGLLTEDGGPAWSARMMTQRFSAGAISDEQWVWFEKQQGSHPAKSILAGLDSLMGVDLRDQLSELRMPILLLHGDSSPFISVEIMASLHARLPRSELQVFPGARHGLPFAQAEECARALRAFLHRHGGTAA